jgi:hypothetical protein
MEFQSIQAALAVLFREKHCSWPSSQDDPLMWFRLLAFCLK